MAVDFAKAVTTAVNAARRVGATCTVTLTRPAPPPNPLTGVVSGSATNQTVTAIQVAPSRVARRYGEAFSRARMVLYVGAQGVTQPLVGDTCTVVGTKYRVTAVTNDAPGGAIISYMLALGADGDRV